MNQLSTTTAPVIRKELNEFRPLIHIGYQKTASTWLQQVVFNCEEAGLTSPWGDWTAEAIEQFVLANPFRYSGDTARRAFEEGLYQAEQRQLIPVISHEDLAGDLIVGKHYWGKEVADRIQAAFPKARILMLIREQKSAIVSAYRESMKAGSTATIQRFIGTNTNVPGFRGLCQIEYLEYDLLIGYYQSLFGKENVLVLPFEFLIKNQSETLGRIFKFVEIEPINKNWQTAKNVGYRGATLEFRRRLNFVCEERYFGNSKPPFTWLLATKLSETFNQVVPNFIHQRFDHQLKQYIDESIGDYFKDSNNRTSQLIGINLSELSYDC